MLLTTLGGTGAGGVAFGAAMAGGDCVGTAAVAAVAGVAGVVGSAGAGSAVTGSVAVGVDILHHSMMAYYSLPQLTEPLLLLLMTEKNRLYSSSSMDYQQFQSHHHHSMIPSSLVISPHPFEYHPFLWADYHLWIVVEWGLLIETLDY